VNISFNANGGLSRDRATWEKTDVTLGLMLLDAEVPVRKGWVFVGWYTQDGRAVFDAFGKAYSRLSPFATSTTLEARWRPSSEALTVTSKEKGESPKNVTLKTALAALASDGLLVGREGKRAITFDLAAESGNVPPTVQLDATAVIGAGTRGFVVDGYNNGRGVVIASGTLPVFVCGQEDGTMEFRNLSFTGLSGSGSVISSTRRLNVWNCVFSSSAGGTELTSAIAAGGCTYVGCCTFSGLKAASAIQANGTFDLCVVYDCGFVANSVKQVLLNGGSGKLIAFNNSFVSGGSGVLSVGAATLMSNLTSYPSPAAGDVAVSFGPVLSERINGVTHSYARPQDASTAMGGCWFWLDDRSDRVGYTPGDTSDGYTALFGQQATMRVEIDQLQRLRRYRARGSVAVADPPAAVFDGRYSQTGVTKTATATVAYDDNTTTAVSQALRTDANGFFVETVKLVGEDVRVRTATNLALSVEGSTLASMRIPRLPYALSSVDADRLETDSGLRVEGGGAYVATLTAGRAEANRLTAYDAVTAGKVAEFGSFRLDGVDLAKGGALSFMKAVKGNGIATFNPADLTVTGADVITGTFTSSSGGACTTTAPGDGFALIRATGDGIRVSVGDFVVTEGYSSGGKYGLWTVPVRKGETVSVKATPADCTVYYVLFGAK